MCTNQHGPRRHLSTRLLTYWPGNLSPQLDSIYLNFERCKPGKDESLGRRFKACPGVSLKHSGAPLLTGVQKLLSILENQGMLIILELIQFAYGGSLYFKDFVVVTLLPRSQDVRNRRHV